MRTTPERQRRAFYRDHESGQWSMTELCQRFQISRPTGYKWIERIREEGLGAVFGGIVVVWLFYSSLVMRLVWVPSMRDSILPFIIGAAEFLLAEMLSPEFRHLWFFLFAGIFGFCTWTSNTTFVRASRDPDNAGLWDDFDPFGMGALVGPIGVVGLLVVAGVGLWIWGATGRVALFAVGFANVALIGQILVIRSFWDRSLGLNQGDD